MFKNDEICVEQPIMYFNIYHIKFKERCTHSQVSFHKEKLNDESKRIFHASEWNSFEQFKNPIAPYHQWEDPGFSDGDNNRRSVMKILSNNCSSKKGINGIPWDKNKFNVGPGAYKIYKVYQEKESMNINVAQKGHSIYIYSLVSKSGVE